MVNITYIILGLSTVLMFGSAFWLILILYKEKKRPFDAPIILNFLSTFDTGRFIGTEVSSKMGKNERMIIEFEPKDIGLDEKDVKNCTIIVDKNKLITLPMGAPSKARHVHIALPPKASMFPSQIKETVFGKAMMWATEAQNAINAELNAVSEGSARKTDILNKLGDGEVSKEFLTWHTELYQDLLKSAYEAKNKGSNTSLIPNTSQNINR